MSGSHKISTAAGGALSGCRLLDCGIELSRLAGWLDDELALPQNEDGSWTFATEDATHETRACRVQLTGMPGRVVGRLSLPRTIMELDGDDAACEEYLRLFTLRFISAGG